jgi:hypothetical protein
VNAFVRERSQASTRLSNSSSLNGMVGFCFEIGDFTAWKRFFSIQPDSTQNRKNARGRSSFFAAVI